MKIAVIGASKGVGLESVTIALNRGHKVIALSRSGLDITHENLISVRGDATEESVLWDCIQSCDAVLVTLGFNHVRQKSTLFSDFSKTLLSPSKKQVLTMPFIVLSGFGAGNSSKFLPIFVRIILKVMVYHLYKDREKMENMISSSNLNWEIVRAGMLTDDDFTGSYTADTRLFKGMNLRKISRKDTAYFMVQEAENPKFLEEFVNLMGARN